MGSTLPVLRIPKKDIPQTNLVKQYVPPNWSDKNAQLYAITYRVPETDTGLASAASVVDDQLLDQQSQFTYRMNNTGGRAGYNAEKRTVMLVFDAIRRAQHSQSATVTQHPLQAGYNIADHIVKQQSRITLEVAMSDAIASYEIAGYTPMWRMNPSKSVSAYQQMEMLMINRQLVTINTRLESYDNMALTDIQVEDSQRTYFGGLAMSLSFQEVFIADATRSYESQRIQTAGETKQGTVQAQAPSTTVTTQHKLTMTNPFANQSVLTTAGGIIPVLKIPGAGNWTSNILSGTKDWFKNIGSF